MGVGVSPTPWPPLPPGKDPVPILQEAGWASRPVWTGGISRPHRDSIPDRPARSSVAIPTELPMPLFLHKIQYLCRNLWIVTRQWNCSHDFTDGYPLHLSVSTYPVSCAALLKHDHGDHPLFEHLVIKLVPVCFEMKQDTCIERRRQRDRDCFLMIMGPVAAWIFFLHSSCYIYIKILLLEFRFL